MGTKYGIISDIHKANLEGFEEAISIFRKEEVNAVVLNGDFTVNSYSLDLEFMLSLLGESGLETYVLPGSHEKVIKLESLIEKLEEEYSNLVYPVTNPKIEKKDHDLIFLPGSDYRPSETANSGFYLEKEYESGLYQVEGDLIRIINMNDIKKHVKHPERTIVFSHIPRKFYGENGVDMAFFGEVKETFSIHGKTIEKGSVIPGFLAYELQKHFPIEIRYENRGNEDLEKVLDETGISKNITGHFHESAGRAHDKSYNPIPENKFVKELYWNASCLDRGIIGILTVNGEEVSYKNINLKLGNL